MTIGEFIYLRQPNIWRRLVEMMGGQFLRSVKASTREVEQLMKEKPGFYRDEKL